MPKFIVVVASSASERSVRTLVRWARALVPATVLVASSGEATATELPEDAIRIHAEEILSGPLSLADALARAVRPVCPRREHSRLHVADPPWETPGFP